jgi:hypothetical protein
LAVSSSAAIRGWPKFWRRGCSKSQRSAQDAQQPQPVPPVEEQQRPGRAKVQQNDESQVRGRLLVDVPVQHGGQNDRVPERADGKELGDALQEGQHDDLEQVQ